MLRTETIERPFSSRWNTGLFSVDSNRNDRSGSGILADSLRTGSELLNSLPAKTVRGLLPSLRRVDVEREQFIYQQDDELEFLYFPETAVLSELHMLDDGRMVEVAITGRSGSIGLASLYSAKRISNCVQTTQAGSVLRIESCLLRKQCRNDPQLPGLLSSSLEKYIRQISLRSVCNMYHSVEERMCTWLLLVSDLGGQSRLRLTHEQIARALGVYRPSVTSIALEMRKRGLIDYSRGGISITDRPGLAAAACACYHELKLDSSEVGEAALTV